MEQETRIIEINGVKMEVDLRQAKTINSYKVGDSVKLLLKKYGDSYESHLGTIIGFDNFEQRPTVVIAYLDVDYSEANIKFCYFNKESKDVEITHLNNWDVPFSKQSVIDRMNKEEAKKEEEIRQIVEKRRVFIELFGKYFNEPNS